MNNQKKIAIFNGFPFHYEMFGYVIHFCKKNSYILTIYTEGFSHYNWFDYYKKIFTDETFDFQIKYYIYFENERYQYDYIFILTDDDPRFKNEWVNNKTICVDHSISIRRNNELLYHISTRPFNIIVKDWALPCFPIIKSSDKINIINNFNNENNIHIAMIGGHSVIQYNVNVINRIKSKNENYKIVLHAISRRMTINMFNNLKDNIELKIYNGLDTFEMMKLLEKCSYFLTDVDNNWDHVMGFSMSGGVPLAFSNLLSLIISKPNNSIYKFTNSIEFEMDGNDDIILPEIKNEPDKENIFELIEKERAELIEMFGIRIKDFMLSCETPSDSASEVFSDTPDVFLFRKCESYQHDNKNTALIVEPRFLKKMPKLLNEYARILGNTWVIVFYCGKDLKQKWEQLLINDHSEYAALEIRELDTKNMNFNDYNNFIKKRELWESLYGEFVLIFQSDTMIKNVEPYTITNYIKLNKSYIGSNMFYMWNELTRENIFKQYKNFNGGLSLRKKEDMIKIIDTFGIEDTNPISSDLKTDAEDVYFTIGSYKLNLPVGDDEFCSHFGIHTIYHDDFFGIHKSAWFPKNELLAKYPDLDDLCYLESIQQSDFITEI